MFQCFSQLSKPLDSSLRTCSELHKCTSTVPSDFRAGQATLKQPTGPEPLLIVRSWKHFLVVCDFVAMVSAFGLLEFAGTARICGLPVLTCGVVLAPTPTLFFLNVRCKIGGLQLHGPHPFLLWAFDLQTQCSQPSGCIERARHGQPLGFVLLPASTG